MNDKSRLIAGLTPAVLAVSVLCASLCAQVMPPMYPAELVKEIAPAPLKWALGTRITAGTRLTYHRLMDNERDISNSFLGSITVLDDIQDTDPYDFFFQVDINNYLSIEITREELKALIVTFHDGHTDGILIMDGPIISIVGSWPNRSRYTPYVSFGVAWMDADVEHNPKWHYGFGGENRDADYAAWVAAGMPPNPNNGYTRTLAPKGNLGYALTAGFTANLYKKMLSAEAFVRYIDINATVHYYMSRYDQVVDDRGDYRFPMSSMAAGVGIRYSF